MSISMYEQGIKDAQAMREAFGDWLCVDAASRLSIPVLIEAGYTAKEAQDYYRGYFLIAQLAKNALNG